ncbi:MAG TPA: site-2 protease family protein [Candidatus Eisenbacteria bacterium]|nr:site-2 protease family protein [Candidatus Eisenbacteria bacterium]
MNRRRLLVHGGLFALTVVTATAAGAIWDGVDPFVSAAAYARGLPYAISLLAILLCHEMGHYLMCRRHGVDASLPYFLPAPPPIVFGTFGAFIRVRSRFPHRRALFDMGAAGPWAGFVVAIVVLFIGLHFSRVETTMPESGVWMFGDSLLTAWLTRTVVGADPNNVIIHPIALAGWFGLLVTSLNLLPAGQLDGGHIVYAAMGRATPALSAVLVAVLAWLGLRGWPGWYLWAAIVVLMNFLGHPPTTDDQAPLDLARLVGAVASLVVFVITFVPEPIRIIP